MFRFNKNYMMYIIIYIYILSFEYLLYCILHTKKALARLIYIYVLKVKMKNKKLTTSPISQPIHNPLICPQHITEFSN